MNNDDKTPIEKFEDLGRKLFQVVKKDATKAEEAVEETIEPSEEPTDCE